MKTLIFSILALVYLTGCKHVSQEPEALSYPTSFAPYIENFEELFGVETDTMITFGSLSEGSPARCLYELNHIEINEKLWASYEETTREVLIIHELGHCELGLLHTESGTSHIMSSFIGFNAQAYTTNLDEEISYMLSDEHPSFID